ncbi:hypothetical protein TNIN_147681 [Trichonephila inaurata madagascariensis]|uniref:Uncharacterized protein n=1 Tax=Trichonephila inaurata madagascariensis TaxID=2747483 RepID=A0A8X6Y7R3_9ARAC|nr:hypothetical protein TNIN_147681 [Trichonephila inaurata madagascariensis]
MSDAATTQLNVPTIHSLAVWKMCEALNLKPRRPTPGAISFWVEDPWGLSEGTRPPCDLFILEDVPGSDLPATQPSALQLNFYPQAEQDDSSD